MMLANSTVGLRGAQALPTARARAAAPRPGARAPRVACSAHSYNWNKALDKAHESLSLREVVDLPPSALQGLADRADDLLATVNVRSVKDLGTWKYYKAARAIQTLAAAEEAGARPDGARANINKILKAQYEGKSLAELLAAPAHALQGLTKDKAAAALEPLGVSTVGDLAGWKYAAWAEALTTLSKYENPDESSR